jgi:hypothetical protein
VSSRESGIWGDQKKLFLHANEYWISRAFSVRNIVFTDFCNT